MLFVLAEPFVQDLPSWHIMSTHIKELLSTCLDSQHWHIKLLKQWPDIVGNLASKVHVEKISGTTLTLGVTDSCWLQELYLLSPLLLETINQTLDHEHIKQIRFKKAGNHKTKKKQSHKGASCNIKSIRLTHAEQYALEQINNEELKQALKAFCIRCHRERL